MDAESSPTLAKPISAPQRIGTYEPLFELGRGGMGTIYLARAVGAAIGVGGFERLVAVKRVHAHLLSRPDAVRRFLEEAKVAALVHHANVVGIHQVGSDEAGHFLVQDYVEGDTLDALIDYASLRRERLPPPIALRIALDALAGLHAVHEAQGADGRPLGILHRDVSTQNLLVGRDGVTRLVDFGIAKYTQSGVVTDGHYLEGRLLYMPPEYLRRGPLDRRVDVYGMGMTLWIALTGATPWPDASEAQLVHLATVEGVSPLSSSGLVIAHAVEAIVARAVEKDAALRFASAREMLEAIEEVGRHTGWIASHGEVAALVERFAGAELAARRAALAKIGASPARSAASRLGPATPSLAENETRPPSPSRPRRRALVVASGAALVVAALAALTIVRSSASSPSAPSPAPTLAASASEERVASPPAPAPAVAVSSAPSIEEKKPVVKADPDPPPRRLRAGATPTAAPTSRPLEPPDRLAGPPSTISTANPYR